MVLTVGMDINPGKKENKRFQKIKYSGLIYFLLEKKSLQCYLRFKTTTENHPKLPKKSNSGQSRKYTV